MTAPRTRTSITGPRSRALRPCVAGVGDHVLPDITLLQRLNAVAESGLRGRVLREGLDQLTERPRCLRTGRECCSNACVHHGRRGRRRRRQSHDAQRSRDAERPECCNDSFHVDPYLPITRVTVPPKFYRDLSERQERSAGLVCTAQHLSTTRVALRLDGGWRSAVMGQSSHGLVACVCNAHR